VIVCPRCGKENQDHYKFCLGCGAELPRDAAPQPKSFTAPTPPAGFASKPAQGAQFGGAAAAQFGGAAATPSAPVGPGPSAARPAAAPKPAPVPAPVAAAPAAMPDTLVCPNCSSSVPFNFKFCGSCGHPMAEMQAAARASAPSPAATAPLAPQPAPAPGAATASLVLIRPDGTEGDSFTVSNGTMVGREAGGMFASDSYLSPKHATFRFSGKTLEVKDEGSLNGLYLRVDADVPVELENGSIFRIGQEIIRFEHITERGPDANGVELMGSVNPGYLGRIRLVIGRDTYGNSYCVPAEGLHLGRERGDIIFPDDGYVSGLHCRIHGEGGKVYLTDVGSSNGTFTRVAGTQSIRSGSMILMGQQLFRVEY
jgi:hypothetical protein